jgi:hypothetical protein
VKLLQKQMLQIYITGNGLTIAQGDESVDNITFATTSGQQFNT